MKLDADISWVCETINFFDSIDKRQSFREKYKFMNSFFSYISLWKKTCNLFCDAILGKIPRWCALIAQNDISDIASVVVSKTYEDFHGNKLLTFKRNWLIYSASCRISSFFNARSIPERWLHDWSIRSYSICFSVSSVSRRNINEEMKGYYRRNDKEIEALFKSIYRIYLSVFNSLK